MRSLSLPRLVLTLSLGLFVTFDASAAGTEEAFNTEAAKTALSEVQLAKCRTKTGPTGEGHVVVTYSPKGIARTAVVDQGPFVGTRSATCIASAFKRTKVPAFKGEPVTVGKKFTIE